MSKPLKIAIYSGVIPSTTFIERLIEGLSNQNQQIILFGFLQKKVNYHPSIKLVTYTNNINKGFQLIKYHLLLLFFKPKEKKKLDKIIANTNKSSRILKLKYYPVLYHHPDILHLQWAKSIIDWVWVKEFGIKLIVSLRGAHVNYSPIADTELANYYKELFPNVDGFHAVSKAIAIEAKKYKATPNKIQVVYSGLELQQIPYQLKNNKASIPLKIISIGRGHWKKGYRYALNSMKLLKSMSINFEYTIVGVRAHEELLYQRSQLGLDDDVTFIGKLPFEEVLKSVKLADVLLLPSVEEGIANVVLEAMAIGTIVISTDCGGMKEVITDKENGFLVPIRDSVAMASALQHVSELTLESYCKITNEARKTIEKQHSNKKMISDMQDLYVKVLNNK